MTKLFDENNARAPGQFGPCESLLTIQQAARQLGVHVWALRRAIKSGAIPAYAPFNRRKLVRLSEVISVINASRIGGGND